MGRENETRPQDIGLNSNASTPALTPRRKTLIEAVRDQLGLELKPAKRPVEVVVLDVEQPTSGK